MPNLDLLEDRQIRELILDSRGVAMMDAHERAAYTRELQTMNFAQLKAEYYQHTSKAVDVEAAAHEGVMERAAESGDARAAHYARAIAAARPIS